MKEGSIGHFSGSKLISSAEAVGLLAHSRGKIMKYYLNLNCSSNTFVNFVLLSQLLCLDLLRESGRIVILCYLTAQICKLLIFTLDSDRICVVENWNVSSQVF